MHEDEETNPEHLHALVAKSADVPELALGSQPSLDLRARGEARATYGRSELCWFGTQQVDVEARDDDVSIVLFRTLRLRGTYDEAAALGRALLRAAARRRAR